jgi:dTMP kinase
MDIVRFISLEGIDYTWKTPISEWLHRDLTAQGNTVLVTRDPPYYISPWDDFVETFERGDKLSRISEAFLFLTARLDNYQRAIAPALAAKQVVIADRFADSWLAYQSVRLAAYFDDDKEAVLDFLLGIQEEVVDAGLLVIPGLTIWISDDPNVTIKRAATADKISKYENLPMQIDVDKQYQDLAHRFPERIRPIDVRGLDIHAAYVKVLNLVTQYLRQ